MEQLLFFFLLVNLFSGEKRIVLHSSTDLTQELLTLKSEFEAFRTNVSSKLSILETENTALKSQLKVALQNQLKSKSMDCVLFSKIKQLLHEPRCEKTEKILKGF